MELFPHCGKNGAEDMMVVKKRLMWETCATVKVSCLDMSPYQSCALCWWAWITTEAHRHAHRWGCHLRACWCQRVLLLLGVILIWMAWAAIWDIHGDVQDWVTSKGHVWVKSKLKLCLWWCLWSVLPLGLVCHLKLHWCLSAMLMSFS